MIVSMNPQKLPKGIKTLSEVDLKRMAESNFQASGWKTYAESPYAVYTKNLKKLQKVKKNG